MFDVLAMWQVFSTSYFGTSFLFFAYISNLEKADSSCASNIPVADFKL